MIELVEIEAGSARYARADGSAINCRARFSHIPDEFMPFTAMAIDIEAHSQAVWAALQEMDVAAYVAPAPVVPQSVSPLQMRKALRAADLKTAADAYLATLDEEAQEAWEYATVILIDDPFIEGARVALGMTEAQRDDLFILAASL